MYDTLVYDSAVTKMRKFFKDEKGFIEVPTQSRLSILAACEDPNTISQFVFDGVNYPLPQTGQMWLEYELLRNHDFRGVYCISTSYRNEPNPIEGRHQKIFPMFEFESHGNMQDLMCLEVELLDYLGFDRWHKEEWCDEDVYSTMVRYDDACTQLDVKNLEAEHEEHLQYNLKEHGDLFFLTDFPQRSHPFWNMKQNDEDKNLYNKVDVIMYGQETIGSAERSCNTEEMREQFYSISDGQYAKLLFNHFSKERVEKELEDYLSLEMFPRFGGGIGMTRMARALELNDI